MFPVECSDIYNKISEITQSLMHENRWSGNKTEFTTWWNGKVLFLKRKIIGPTTAQLGVPGHIINQAVSATAVYSAVQTPVQPTFDQHTVDQSVAPDWASSLPVISSNTTGELCRLSRHEQWTHAHYTSCYQEGSFFNLLHNPLDQSHTSL